MVNKVDELTFWSTWIQSIPVLELSRSRRFRPELKDAFFDYLGLSTYSKVLDVGCGPGTFTRYLAEYIKVPGFICGVDKDYNFIEYATKRAQEEGISEYVKYVVADACSLPFEDETFDAVTSYTLIEHIPDTEAFVREIMRVCETGGILSVMAVANFKPGLEPHQSPLDKRMDELLHKLQTLIEPIEGQYRIGRCFFIEDAPKILDHLGLKNIRISGFYTPFCIDDYRYSIEDKQKILLKEFVEPTEELVRRLIDNFPEKFSKDTISLSEAEELLRLIRENYEKQLCDIKNGKKRWIIEGRPSLIVSGEK